MDVLKRSEFCGGSKCIDSRDVPTGTVFRARLHMRSNFLHVWVKTNTGDATCIGEPTSFCCVGNTAGSSHNIPVYDYEVLNATLVIDD